MEPHEDVHQRHLYEGEPDEDLISALEPDQLVQATEEPLPPFRFGTRATIGLWALRVFVLVIAALVIYVFTADLAHGALLRTTAGAPAWDNPRGSHVQALGKEKP